MSFLENYLNARAQRTNPAYATQLAAEQKRGYELEDIESNRAYIEDIMGQQAVPGMAAQREPVGGLFDQAMLEEDVGAPMPAGDGLMGMGQPQLPSPGQITAGAGDVTPNMMATTQAGVEAQPGTGYLGGQMGGQEMMMRLMGSGLEDVRGVGGRMMQDQLKPTVAKPLNKFAQMREMMKTPEGRAELQKMRDVGALGGQTINVGEKLRTAEDQARLDDLAAMNKAARARVEGARGQASEALRGVSDLEYTLDLVNAVETGTGEETLLAARKLAKTFGFDVDVENIAKSEALQIKLGDFVMARVAETKGAISEKEMDLFKLYSANYGKTQAGNRKILEFKNAKYKRDIAIGRMIVKMQKKGKSSYDIDLAMDEYVAKNSLMDILQRDVDKTGMPSTQAVQEEIERRKKGGK